MEQLIEKILACCSRAGIAAVRAQKASLAPRPDAPVAAICLDEAVLTPAGFGSYLGEDEQGAVCGLRLRARLHLTVLSPAVQDAAIGAAAVEQILAALTGQLRLSEIQVAKSVYDGELECFSTAVDATVSALLVAAEPDDGAAFTDFILKGTIT